MIILPPAMTKHLCLVFLLSTVCYCPSVSGEMCDQDSLQEMQTEFQECLTGLSYQFEDTRNTFPGQEYLQESGCIFFSKTIKECGKAWQKCHSEEEVQQLQDLHLGSLLSQYKDIQLDHCQLVKEYMQSGRQKEIIQHEEKCDDEVTARAQEKFQSCSHSFSTEAYQKVRDVQDKDVVKNILCDTLNIIHTVCREDLEECFSDDDIAMMTVSHMKEMKKFLVRIARGKVDGEALERCDGIGNNRIISKERKEYTTSETPQIPNYKQKGNKALKLGENENLSDDIIYDGLLNNENALEENDKVADKDKSEKTIIYPPKVLYKSESENSADNINTLHTIYLVLCAAYFLNMFY